MGRNEDIDKAIMAHGLWKQRLLSAIASGSSEYSVYQVQADNRCEFGKWLYGLPAEERLTDHGKKILSLHASFHKEAARILQMALEGHKSDAEQALGPGGEYSRISGQLAVLLIRWKETI